MIYVSTRSPPRNVYFWSVDRDGRYLCNGQEIGKPDWEQISADQRALASGAREGYDAASFSDILLGGLAGNGGLWMPYLWPHFKEGEIKQFAGETFTEVALFVLADFVGDCFTDDEARADVTAAYATFDHPDVAPLVEMEPGLYLLELFHGPTLAFKDIALQLGSKLNKFVAV